MIQELMTAAYQSGRCKPLFRNTCIQVDDTLQCCGLTAAYLQAGNPLTNENLLEKIEQWLKSLGYEKGFMNGFIAGFDGAYYGYPGLCPQSYQEGFSLGRECREIAKKYQA